MKLKCGVIGVGHLGQHHANKFFQIPEADLIGVCDINAERAAEIASQYANTKAYNDYRKLLKHCDAVSIAADTSKHYEIARCALENNVHVLVEKPITQTTEQAQKLIELAEQKKLLLQTGHLERFSPAIVELAKLIKNPLFINCQRISTFVSRRGLAESDVIFDLMIHDIDLVCYLMNQSLPSSINAVGGRLFTNDIDICDARLIFDNGRTATLTASRIGSRTNRTLKVFEFDACYIADLQANTLQHIERGDQKDQNAYQLKTTEIFCENSKDALLLEIESFVHSICHNEPAKVTGKDGLLSVQLATKIRNSAQSTERMWHVHS